MLYIQLSLLCKSTTVSQDSCCYKDLFMPWIFFIILISDCHCSCLQARILILKVQINVLKLRICVWILIFSVFAPFPFGGMGCLGKFYNVHVWVIEFLWKICQIYKISKSRFQIKKEYSLFLLKIKMLHLFMN